MKGWIYLRAKHMEQMEYHRDIDYLFMNNKTSRVLRSHKGGSIISFEFYESCGFKPMHLTPRQAIKIIKLKGFKINVDN